MKDIIPQKLKDKIWEIHNNNINNSNLFISECLHCRSKVKPQIKTFEKLCKIYKVNNYDYSSFYESGIKNIHYSHIRAEKYGGEISENNLIILCSECNLEQGTQDYNIFKQKPKDTYMLDNSINNNSNNMEIDSHNNLCCGITSKGFLCKNKPIKNSNFCHIHI